MANKTLACTNLKWAHKRDYYDTWWTGSEFASPTRTSCYAGGAWSYTTAFQFTTPNFKGKSVSLDISLDIVRVKGGGTSSALYLAIDEDQKDDSSAKMTSHLPLSGTTGSSFDIWRISGVTYQHQRFPSTGYKSIRCSQLRPNTKYRLWIYGGDYSPAQLVELYAHNSYNTIQITYEEQTNESWNSPSIFQRVPGGAGYYSNVQYFNWTWNVTSGFAYVRHTGQAGNPSTDATNWYRKNDTAAMSQKNANVFAATPTKPTVPQIESNGRYATAYLTISNQDVGSGVVRTIADGKYMPAYFPKYAFWTYDRGQRVEVNSAPPGNTSTAVVASTSNYVPYVDLSSSGYIFKGYTTNDIGYSNNSSFYDITPTTNWSSSFNATQSAQQPKTYYAVYQKPAKNTSLSYYLPNNSTKQTASASIPEQYLYGASNSTNNTTTYTNASPNLNYGDSWSFLGWADSSSTPTTLGSPAIASMPYASIKDALQDGYTGTLYGVLRHDYPQKKITINANGGSADGSATRGAHYLYYYGINSYVYSNSTEEDSSAAVTANKNPTYSISAAPSRTGYSLKNYNTAANGSGTSFSSVQQALDNKDVADGATIYAQWTRNTTTVNIYDNVGTLTRGDSSITQVTTGKQYRVTISYDTTSYSSLGLSGYKAGYAYNGLYTAASGGTQVWTSSGTCTTTNGYFNSSNIWKYTGTSLNVYAQYSIKTFTIKFNGNSNTGGTVPATMQVTYGNSFTMPTGTPTRSGYNFLYWTDPTGARWDPGWHTDSWAYDSDQYDIGSDNTLELSAVWEERILYTIKYNGNGATGGVPPTQYVYTGDEFSIPGPAPTRTNYTFLNWTSPDEKHTVWAIDTPWTWKYTNGQYGIENNTLTLTANWQIQSATCTIRYRDQNADGSYPSTYTTLWSGTVNAGSTHTETIAQTTSHVALTCSVTGTASGATASYDRPRRTGHLVIKANGGSSDRTTSAIRYGSTGDTISPMPTRSGYTLNGLYTATTGGTKVVNADGTKTNDGTYSKSGAWLLNSDVTVYAQWTRQTYTISYTLNGGAGSNPTSYNVDTATFTLTNPTRSGWTFTGWSGTGLTGSANTSVSIAKGSTGNRSYAAHWSKTITLTQHHGGTTTSTQTYTLTDNTTSHMFTLVTASTSYSGWTFIGWRDSATPGPIGDTGTYGPTGTITLSENKDVYASFSKSLTSTFKDYNGTTQQTRTVSGTAYGNNSAGGVASQYPTVKAPAISTRTGWTSIGWQSSSTSLNNNVSIASGANYTLNESTATTYYGTYKQTVTLSYVANGGSSTPSSQSATRYANTGTTNVSAVTFTLAGAIKRAGYAFQGWSVNNGVGTKAAGSSITTPTSVTALEATAQWQFACVVNIYNGTSWQKYQPYIYDGTSWKQMVPYVYNGTAWVLTSEE